MNRTHPMQRPRGYLVCTAAVNAAMRELSQSLQMAEAGMVCIAPTRFGKTTMLSYAEERFRAASSAVVLRSKMVSNSEKDRNPTAKFWRRLMGLYEGNEARLAMQQPYQALLNYVRNECDKLGVDTVVFAIDEAQKLTFHECDMLKDLSEDLLELGLRPYMFLVGQPQFDFLIARLRRANRQEFVQRFMLRVHRFEGLDLDDVRRVFNHIDTATWPEGVSTTYAQHFVPDLWARGWRMADQAEPFWQAFKALAHGLGRETQNLKVGAQFVTGGAIRLLLELEQAPSSRDRSVLYSRAVEGSGYPEYLRAGPLEEDSKSSEYKASKRWAASMQGR